MQLAPLKAVIIEAAAQAEVAPVEDPLQTEARLEAQRHSNHVHRFSSLKEMELKLRLGCTVLDAN